MEWDEESHVWVTYVPELANISTYGETEEEALEATRELIAGYLEAAEKEHIAPPSTPSRPPRIVEVEV